MPDTTKKQQTENVENADIKMPPAGILRFRKQLIMLVHLAVFSVSLFGAFLLANNMQLRREWLIEQYPRILIGFLVIKLIVFGLFKQYQGWWRFVGISDLLSILKASLASTLLIVIAWFAVLQIDQIRRALPQITQIGQGIFIADMFATVLLLGGLRMLVRLYHEEFRAVSTGRLKRFLIIGAGNAGEALLRELHRSTEEEYDVVGFVDDDLAKHGVSILGIPVLC